MAQIPLITIFTDTGSVSAVISYTEYLERIATAFETVANNSNKMVTTLQSISSSSVLISNALTSLSTITSSLNNISVSASEFSKAAESISSATNLFILLSTSTGIRTVSPYDWVKPTEIYSWYNQGQTTLVESTETIETLVTNITTITNNMPKFV